MTGPERRRVGRLLACGLALAAASALAGETPAQTPLDTRAATHDGFARLVFQAHDPEGAVVPMTATVDGTQLRIVFTSPVSATLDTARVKLAAYLDGLTLSADGLTLTARLKRPVELRPQPLGRTIEVLDLYDQKPAQQAEAPSGAKEETPAAKPASPDVGASPPGAAPGQPAPAKSDATLAEGSAAKSAPPPEAPKPAATPPKEAKSAPAPGAGTKPATAAKDAKTGPAEVAAKPAPPAAEAKPAPAPPPPPPPPPPPAPAAPPPGVTVGHAAGKGLQVRFTELDDGVSIRFEWSDPTGAAVFRRANGVWAVFDRTQKLDFGDFQPARWPVVTAITQLPTQSGTAIRLETATGYWPEVKRAGTTWIVELQRHAPPLASPLQPAIRRDGEAVAIELAALDPASPVSFVDPEVGDPLVAVPLPELGQGMGQDMVFPDVDILDSAQGLAFRQLRDDLAIQSAAGKVAITAPRGLMLASDEDRALASRPPPASGTLLHPRDWQGKAEVPFIEQRQALVNAIVTAAEDDRTSRRVDLARFLFANGFAAEALGELRLAAETVPNLTDDPAVRLMMGAAELMMHEDDLAAADLADRGLDGRVDSALWRAALAAAQQDWKTAGPLAQQGQPAIADYPPPVANRLALVMADVLLRTGNRKDAAALAQSVLDSAPSRGQRDEAAYLAGRAAAEVHDVERATQLWSEAAASPEIDLGRAQSAFALTLMAYEAGQMSRADVIAAVDRLRYAWRGDDFEIQVLRKLADLYVADGDFRNAFETLQRIPAGFPDTDAAKDAAAEMQKIFVAMFLGPNADKLSPLTSLALYQQFKELTPSGADGDSIIRKLADRLVAVDLLERAGGLLDDQVRNRLKGIDQARVAAQLALVRLLDHRPADAVTALDVKVDDGLPADLARQRTELRARAQFELGHPDDALKTLGDDDGDDADRLRGEIYESGKDWAALASTLRRHLVDPGSDGKLADPVAATVLHLASAMALGQDKAGLEVLARKYGGAMDQSAYKDAFRIIAGATPESADVKTAADRIAQMEDLQSFMSGYRQRLQQDRLSAIN